MKFCKIIFIIIALLGIMPKLIAQKPIGIFKEDSVQLGEIITYTLVAKHDSKLEVLFPDITFNYYPFQLVDKIYFPTKTTNNISIDSAIYKLRTFEIDKIQSLALPVFILENGDSTIISSKKDSVYLNEEILGDIIGIKLKSKSMLLPMKTNPNLVLIFLQILVIISAIFIWWLVFGKVIKKQFSLLRLFRNHSEFKSTFDRYLRNINKKNIEKALILWKKHVGKLQNKAFNTMTTPEIVENISNENLEESLKEIDSSIYGTQISSNIAQAFNNLKNIAEIQYSSRKKEIA